MGAEKTSKIYLDDNTCNLATNNTGRQLFYYDSHIPCFALSITPSGRTKTFTYQARVDGKTKRISIGKFGHISADEARGIVAEMLRQRDKKKQSLRVKKIKSVNADKESPPWATAVDKQAEHTDIVASIMNELEPHISNAIRKVLFEGGKRDA